MREKGRLARCGASATGMRSRLRETPFNCTRPDQAPRISTLQQHNSTMRFLRSLIPSLLLLGAGVADAASSWNFDEAVISVIGKGNTGAAFKDK